MRYYLYRVVMSKFCCGLIVDYYGYIAEAAPIMKWSENKRIDIVISWVMNKGGSINVL